MSPAAADSTTFAQCTLCEAHCGITVTVSGEKIRITGDPDDAMSKGYICPKASALADLHSDPDRLRTPMLRQGDGFVPIGWDEALRRAADGLRTIQDRHGSDAVAMYLGNPGAHSAAAIAAGLVRQLIGSRNNYSATSVDQLPQHRVAQEMFGHFALLPVPDLERTDHMLMLGANPAVSNGSIMTAPGMRERLRSICDGGGTVVVVDPRRTETVKHASEHVQIAPGGDAYLLLGMLQVMFAEGLVDPGRLAERIDGRDELRALAGGWDPERAAPLAGVEAATIVRLAREFAGAERPVAYGRVGVCHQVTGTLTHWLINALNILVGRLDEPGGAMFTTPAVDIIQLGSLVYGDPTAGRPQRVSGLPPFMGEWPVAGLADEILTPGEGQVRGMLTYAGNPVLSTPAGSRLDAALATLEFMVSVDMYVTETSRHADIILPPISHLERDDIDVVLPPFSVRNHIRYNPAAVPAPEGGRTDWQILIALGARIGRGRIGQLRNLGLRLLSPAMTPDRLIDLALRTGPYGMRRRGLSGLTIGKVKAAKHGIDLGRLEPRLPGGLRTKGKRIALAPPSFLREAGELERLAAEREQARADGFDLVLIGRRQLRSNNSWMHNSPRLMKGADRCTALLHPDDAAARGLEHGQQIRVRSRIGAIELPVEVSDEIRPGVISIPHGFGHRRERVGWRLAARKPGVSVNDITDPGLVDRLTGNAALNAAPVRVDAVATAAPAPAETVGAEA